MSVFYVSGRKASFAVGRDPGSDLVLESTYVSRHHLIFKTVRSDVASVEILGANGAAIRGTQVNKGYKGYIRVGDCVSIGDIRLVWTGRRADNTGNILIPAGRRLQPDVTPVEIEGPPPRRIPEKPSIMLAAGPALTMAIPIVLGAGRTVAVLSSIFAAAWAVAGVLGRARRQKAEEARRRNTYLAYISECEGVIKSRLKELMIARNDIYPPVDAYLRQDMVSALLWTGAAGDSDILTVRTGRGTIESPLEIVIPRERFAGIDDSLRDLPGIVAKKYQTVPACPVLVCLDMHSVSGFMLGDDNDRQTLSALILQLAVNFPPDVLDISIKAERELMLYYMWISWLPHTRAGEDFDKKKRVLITDDPLLAYGEAEGGTAVILVVSDPGQYGSGSLKYINKTVSKYMRFDMIPEQFCYSYAAQMSVLWGNDTDIKGIPDKVPFGMLIDDIYPSQNTYRDTEEAAGTLSDAILTNYLSSDVSGSIKAPIGLTEGGKKTFLDLHERCAGPHGLIAGTTGSGKSELLSTMIMSFALMYPPDKLSFFLIDYKGGGMSNLFGDLPHVLGSISNLTGACTQRAMIALKSENIRRQEIFAESSVNNISDYIKLYEAGKVKEPLPHVLIIVDEFAELRNEEPDFMDGLISISRVGRSLGMHLILATQKPAGAVDDRIRGNSRFRIALRLLDKSDSTDMLARPDAAYIRECGRGYLQVGNDEIFECFQSGYVMSPAFSGTDPPEIYTDFLMDRKITEIKETDALGNCNRDNPTWYELILKAIIAAEKKYDGSRPPALYLPPLPEQVEDDEAFAVFDNPYEQRYESALYDPDMMGNILAIGKSGSGKSELVHTILNRINIGMAVYIIDYGGGRLSKAVKGEHLGGYIGDDRPDNITRLTGFIDEKLSERRKKQGSSSASFCPILLVADNLDEIEKAAGQIFTDHMRHILTMGKSVGIYVLATKLGSALSRDEKLFDTCLFLGDNDPYVIATAFRISARDVVRIADIPGRGIALWDNAPLEFQTVTVRNDCNRAPPQTVKAEKYPYVPLQPTLDEFLETAVYNMPASEGGKELSGLPAGYEKISGKLFTLPLKNIRCILIGGKAYSGRHTLLFNISVTAALYGIKCVRADTYEALLSYCRESTEFKIITIESVADILDGFYSKEADPEVEDELASYMTNPQMHMKAAGSSFVMIGIVKNETRTKHFGRKIYEAMMRHPYGIHLGGHLDESKIFDFSYLPFSTQQKSQTRGNATILKYDEKTFSGDILLPVRINVDNSQTL